MKKNKDLKPINTQLLFNGMVSYMAPTLLMANMGDKMGFVSGRVTKETFDSFPNLDVKIGTAFVSIINETQHTARLIPGGNTNNDELDYIQAAQNMVNEFVMSAIWKMSEKNDSPEQLAN